MNLVDGLATELLQELAPRTYSWLCMIRDGEHRGSAGKVSTTASLTPLLKCIAETFIPLMQQNEVAYEDAKSRGQRLFNEAAFDRGEALYDGNLMGLPFRSVIKTFQVVTWRELCEQWRALDDHARQGIVENFPPIDGCLFNAKNAHLAEGANNNHAEQG
jgi:hypothetical protein